MQYEDYLCIVYIMHFIENNKFNISNQVCAFIEHASKNFSRHDQATCFWVDLNVARQNADRITTESLLEVPEFLVRQSLDRGSIDRPV